MRTSPLWTVGWIALACGLAAAVAGALAGSELGTLVAGYGVMCALASAYLVAGLAIRERVRRASAARQASPDGGQLLGRRVF